MFALLVMTLPFTLALARSGALFAGRMAAEGQVSPLEGVKLGRTGLDPHALGDYTLSFSLVSLVHRHYQLGRLMRPLPQLQAHERIGRLPD